MLPSTFDCWLEQQTFFPLGRTFHTPYDGIFFFSLEFTGQNAVMRKEHKKNKLSRQINGETLHRMLCNETLCVYPKYNYS